MEALLLPAIVLWIGFPRDVHRGVDRVKVVLSGKFLPYKTY
jgi:cyanate lyase